MATKEDVNKPVVDPLTSTLVALGLGLGVVGLGATAGAGMIKSSKPSLSEKKNSLLEDSHGIESEFRYRPIAKGLPRYGGFWE